MTKLITVCMHTHSHISLSLSLIFPSFSFYLCSQTDKLLLFFTTGVQVFLPATRDALVANITKLKNSAPDPVTISVFKLVDDVIPGAATAFDSIIAPVRVHVYPHIPHSTAQSQYFISFRTEPLSPFPMGLA